MPLYISLLSKVLCALSHSKVETVEYIRASDRDLATLIIQTAFYPLMPHAFSATLSWCLTLIHSYFMLYLGFFSRIPSAPFKGALVHLNTLCFCPEK